MKTTENIRTVKLIFSLGFTIMIGATTWAQPRPASYSHNKNDAATGNIEEYLLYKAPSVDFIEAAEAQSRLETWAYNAEQYIRYNAPTAEAVEINEARVRLVKFAQNAENTSQYVAPTIEAVEIMEAYERFELYANKVINELLYHVPAQKPVFAFEYKKNPVVQDSNGLYFSLK